MQIYALNKNGFLVRAADAVRHEEHHCPECRQKLSLRKGPIRVAHFSHICLATTCHFQNKSPEHIAVQHHLQELFIDLILEKKFSLTGRIADSVLEERHIVFEVQCSKMTLTECKMRIKDYKKEGFKVVWIFHDRRFNRIRRKAVEKYLTKSPHYYTNINAQGEGVIYTKKGKARVPVDLTKEIFYFPTEQSLINKFWTNTIELFYNLAFNKIWGNITHGRERRSKKNKESDC